MTLPADAAAQAPAAVVHALYPLVSAEATAEASDAAAGAAVEPADLEQAVWLRLLELLADQRPPTDPARWVRDTVRAEVRRARRTARRDRPYADDPTADPDRCPDRLSVGAYDRRALHAAL
ncbi:sigma-70 family RNA polymerase sigma factor, partial [Streptomyces sp. NPDC059744]